MLQKTTAGRRRNKLGVVQAAGDFVAVKIVANVGDGTCTSRAIQ
jgi:hypothetical protein